jgi:hypothetical protein
MAYTSATLSCANHVVGAAPQIWIYTTTDAHTDVDAAGYFSDGVAKGVRVNDICIVVDTDSATCTVHSFSSATTINAATLA